MSHRLFALVGLLFFAHLAVAQPATSPTQGPAAPEGLLVNLLRRPDLTVITDPAPRFSWIVNDPARDATQSAYQIRLSPAADSNTVRWDSGRVSSNESTAVAYGGPSLQPDQSYTWTVRTWNAAGLPSPWSSPQRFNTGDFAAERNWPGESRWVRLGQPDGTTKWVMEDRHPLAYHEIAPAAVRPTDGASTRPAGTTAANRSYFITFPRAAFATLRLTLTSATDGHVVEVHLGEKMTGGDTVDRKPGGSIYYGRHTLTLKQGRHTYDLALPRHISKMPHSLILPEHMPEVEPYRYVEIHNAPSEITPADVKQVALYYQFDDDASSFTSSDSDLNAIWDLCKYTMKAASFIGVYTDGVRERMPYEADAYIQMLGHYAVDREYAIARYSGEFLHYHATWPTEWILQSVLIAHADYLHTGDAESLRKNYETLKAKTLVALAREDGLISTRAGKVTPDLMKSIHYDGKALRDITDWPPPTEVDGFQFVDYNTVVNAFHYRALVLMADIATATDHPADARQFRDRAEKVKGAFDKAFFNSEKGVYVDGEGAAHASLHANAFPLAFGLVPQERVPAVVAFLKSRGMACGPYGAQFLVESLYGAGAPDAGLGLLTSKSDRSWVNMIRVGSTMTTEAWDAKYKKNLTWNHAWGAAPANLIPRGLMGVEPLAPGFARFRIKPQPASLTLAALKMPTVRGTVHVAYRRTGDVVQLDVTVPANTRAEVHVPTGDPKSVRESDAAPDARAGVRTVGDAVYDVGGGTYHFTAAAPR
jgi:hypothetical protein